MAVSEAEEERQSLLQFLYIAPIGLAQTETDGAIVMINPVCAQLLLPLVPDAHFDNLFVALESVAPDLRLRVQQFPHEHGMVCDALLMQVNAGAPNRDDVQYLTLTLLKTGGNRLMAVLDDVSVSVRRDRLLRQGNAWFNAILTGVTDYALVLLDSTGKVDGWNDSIGRVAGFGAEAIVGRSYAAFYPEGAITCERVSDRLLDADRDGWSVDEGWRLRGDGSRYWGSCLIAPLLPGVGPASAEAAPTTTRQTTQRTTPQTTQQTTQRPTQPHTGYSLILRDISDKRGASDALRRAVDCDHLTGIANRRSFFDTANTELGHWVRSPRPLSVVIFDADHFKQINDTHGHGAGDRVLCRLADCLLHECRDVNTVARIGGEEFAVLLPGTDAAGALDTARRICRAVAALDIAFDGVRLRLTVSGGAAAMEAQVDSIDALIQRADLAMYAAKAAGRNRALGWHAELVRSAQRPAAQRLAHG